MFHVLQISSLLYVNVFILSNSILMELLIDTKLDWLFFVTDKIIDTIAPVAKITKVRTIIAIAASQSWSLYQIDVKNTFLHGNLK